MRFLKATLPFALLALILWQTTANLDGRRPPDEISGTGNMKIEILGVADALHPDIVCVQDTLQHYLADYFAENEVTFSGEWDLKVFPADDLDGYEFYFAGDISWLTTRDDYDYQAYLRQFETMDLALDYEGEDGFAGTLAGTLAHPTHPDEHITICGAQFRMKVAARSV